MMELESALLKQANATECPITARSKQSLSGLLLKEDDITTDDIVQIAELDPGFSLALLKQAGKAKKRRITTLSHAILLIGIPRVVTLLKRLPVLESSYPAAVVSLIKRLYFRQTLAANFAMDWAIARKDSEINELPNAALNHAFVELLLCLFMSERAAQLDQKKQHTSDDHLAIEQTLLGQSLHALSSQIATSWRLPELICESYKDGFNPKIKGIRLANNISKWIYYHCSCHYPESLIKQISDYLRLPPEQVSANLNRSFVKVLRETHGIFPHTPYVRMLMSYPEQVTRKTNKLSLQQHGSNKSLKQYIQAMRSKQTNGGASSIIKLAVDALDVAVGAERIIFLSHQHDKQILTSFYAANSQPSAKLKSISVSLEINRLFRELVKKEQLLVISSEKNSTYHQLLPPLLVPSDPNTVTGIYSVFVKQRSIGCLFFQRQLKNELADAYQKQCKLVCKELKLALVSLSDYKVKKCA